MKREQYDELKQRVINLRQSAVAEQGSENHAKIWGELRDLEESLQNAKITDSSVPQNITPKFEGLDNDNTNIIEKPLSR